MIAVTVATPDYADMAHENAMWFKRNSGIDTMVVHVSASTLREGFETKLSLDKLTAGKIVFFDSDYRLIKDVRGWIQGWDIGNKIIGVHEPSASKGDDKFFSFLDPRTLGIPIKTHINTGFFACDTSKPIIKRVFSDARQIFHEKTNGLWNKITDQTDQTILNLAIHRNGARVKLADSAWNWFYYAFREGWCDFPREVIGLHAAGVFGPVAKREHLEHGTKFLGIPR
jgi:hypothetical protein